MIEKIVESLTQHKGSLASYLEHKDHLEAELKAVIEAIHQVRGAVAALEYVKKLHDESADSK